MRDREAALSSGLGVGFARGCRPGFKSRSAGLDFFPVVPDSTHHALQNS